MRARRNGSPAMRTWSASRVAAFSSTCMTRAPTGQSSPPPANFEAYSSGERSWMSSTSAAPASRTGSAQPSSASGGFATCTSAKRPRLCSRASTPAAAAKKDPYSTT